MSNQTDTAAAPEKAAVGSEDLLLDVRGLTVEYLGADRSVTACADVTLQLRHGEILGVAGESGSGKSTLITALTRLQRPPAVTTAGQILLRHNDRALDLAGMDEKQLRSLRWNTISIVLQSAMDALNPVMRLGSFPPLHAPLEKLSGIPGVPPDLNNLPAGCPFHPRCPYRFAICDVTRPDLLPVARQHAACHLHDPQAQPPPLPVELMSDADR